MSNSNVSGKVALTTGIRDFYENHYQQQQTDCICKPRYIHNDATATAINQSNASAK